VFDRYSILSRQAVFVARKEAGQSGAQSICSEHLLIGIVSVDPGLITQFGIEMEPDQIRTGSCQWHAGSEPIPDSQDLSITDELGAVLERAASNADLYQCREIRTEHLLLSLMEVHCHASELLTACGFKSELIAAHAASVDCSSPQLGVTQGWSRYLSGH
jgi:ATP-dependent Clp protease ATP-binding subunit ClpA